MTDWRTDRARVQDIRIERLLREAWSAAFPLAKSQALEPDGTDLQRAGVDRWLVFEDGRRIPVEDKVRFRPYSGDILLELEHEFHDRSRPSDPGWIRKPLQCHYLGFLWVDSGHFEAYPFLALQQWWHALGAQPGLRLKQHYPVVCARNRSYVTRNAVVGSQHAWLGLRRQLTQAWEVTDAVAYEKEKGGIRWDSPIRARFDPDRDLSDPDENAG